MNKLIDNSTYVGSTGAATTIQHRYMIVFNRSVLTLLRNGGMEHGYLAAEITGYSNRTVKQAIIGDNFIRMSIYVGPPFSYT